MAGGGQGGSSFADYALPIAGGILSAATPGIARGVGMASALYDQRWQRKQDATVRGMLSQAMGATPPTEPESVQQQIGIDNSSPMFSPGGVEASSPALGGSMTGSPVFNTGPLPSAINAGFQAAADTAKPRPGYQPQSTGTDLMMNEALQNLILATAVEDPAAAAKMLAEYRMNMDLVQARNARQGDEWFAVPGTDILANRFNGQQQVIDRSHFIEQEGRAQYRTIVDPNDPTGQRLIVVDMNNPTVELAEAPRQEHPLQTRTIFDQDGNVYRTVSVDPRDPQSMAAINGAVSAPGPRPPASETPIEQQRDRSALHERKQKVLAAMEKIRKDVATKSRTGNVGAVRSAREQMDALRKELEEINAALSSAGGLQSGSVPGATVPSHGSGEATVTPAGDGGAEAPADAKGFFELLKRNSTK